MTWTDLTQELVMSYQIFCGKCGGDVHVDVYDDKSIINVEPCGYCEKEKYDEGYQQGLTEGS